METIKKGDFVEIEYTGRLAEDNMVFDTTSAEEAKNAGLQPSSQKPLVVCVGQGRMLQGIDEQLEGKEIGKSYEMKVKPEKGFGKKSAKLMQLIATSKFRKENIRPMPGLQVNVDGHVGVVKTVTGGRTIVDFNHPLSGKELVYAVQIKRKVNDVTEQVNSVLNTLGLKFEVVVDAEKLTLTSSEVPPAEIEKVISDEIKKHVQAIKEISFSKKAATPEEKV